MKFSMTGQEKDDLLLLNRRNCMGNFDCIGFE